VPNGEFVMNESQIEHRRWKYLLWALFIVIFIVVVLYASIPSIRDWYIKTHYPYGWSHCCDKALMIALVQYAEANNGEYPAGESCSEASLSLLYPKYLDANTLRGKIVPMEIVEKQLQQDKKLGPDSCGWHYVEGLTRKDDPRLALVWDKVGLGHNGEILSGGGHYVIFVDTQMRYIDGNHWNDFEDLQERLLLEKKGDKLSATEVLDLEEKWRSIVDEK
jgi:hypothetical protein